MTDRTTEIPNSWNNGERGKMEMRFTYHMRRTILLRIFARGCVEK